MLSRSYHATGVTINVHPMIAYREPLRAEAVRDSRELARLRNRAEVAVAGLVVIRQRPHTANGVLFMLLEDEHGFINVVVRKDDVAPNEAVVKYAQFVLVRGHVGREGAALNVVGHQFERLDGAAVTHTSRDFR